MHVIELKLSGLYFWRPSACMHIAYHIYVEKARRAMHTPYVCYEEYIERFIICILFFLYMRCACALYVWLPSRLFALSFFLFFELLNIQTD